MLLERGATYRSSSTRQAAYVIAILAVAGAALLIATMPPTAIEGPILHFDPYGWNRPATPAQPPTGWIKIDAGTAFSFYAPPGTSYRPLQGIDSFVGEIVGTHFKMQFDFGRYSADSSELARDKDFRSEPVVIDGRQAEITSATDNAWEKVLDAPYAHVISLYMPGATCDKATFTYGLSCQPNRLGIYGAARTSEGADTVRKIYKTLRFPD